MERGAGSHRGSTGHPSCCQPPTALRAHGPSHTDAASSPALPTSAVGVCPPRGAVLNSHQPSSISWKGNNLPSSCQSLCLALVCLAT